MTRRVLLGTGAAVVVIAGGLAAAELTGRLDDVAEAVGLDPKPLPDPADTGILQRAAVDGATLLAVVEATARAHPALALSPVVAIIREQLDALGGATPATAPTPPPDASDAVAALEEALGVAATSRATDAVEAAAPELIRVLASISAGHAQTARAVRRLR